MSIWSSLPAPDGDAHEDDCAHWDKTKPQHWEIRDRPCDCGQPDAPLVYQHSNVLPEVDGERGGYVDIASLAKFVREYRVNPAADPAGEDWTPEPFLRFGVNDSTAILTARNVRMIHATLGEWLKQVDGDTKKAA